jgi:hypothetical protein
VDAQKTCVKTKFNETDAINTNGKEVTLEHADFGMDTSLSNGLWFGCCLTFPGFPVLLELFCATVAGYQRQSGQTAMQIGHYSQFSLPRTG